LIDSKKKLTLPLFYWLLLPVLFALFLFPNKNALGQLDTTRFYFIRDSLRNKDTVKFSIDQDALFKSKRFYDSIRRFASKNYFTKKLHGFLFRKPSSFNIFDNNKQIEQGGNPFSEYEGKIIRKIGFEQLPVFGTSVDDTTYSSEDWYEEIANWLHIPTNQKILESNLLVEPGEKVDPTLLSDNERIFRNLQSVKDSRIFVLPAENSEDTVDLLIITQDYWSKGFSVNLKNIYATDVELYDNNFIGFGHRFSSKFVFDFFKSNYPGYEGSYRVKNIGKTFINSEFFYENVFDEGQFGMRLNRGFYSYKTRWVGGLEVKRQREIKDFSYGDSLYENQIFDKELLDVWLGYALPISANNERFSKGTRFITAFRFMNNNYIVNPTIPNRYYYSYADYNFYLGSFSWSREKFYKTSLIYNFGKTEDIPMGDLLNLTYGIQESEFFTRGYTGINYRHGRYYKNFGYLKNSYGLGSFIYHNKFEQGVFNFKSNYISKLFSFSGMHIRQFFKLNYVWSINRFPHERVRFDKREDIRGFNENLYFGNKKLVFSSETVGFTNFFYYGFRFVFYGFWDVGFIGPEHRFILENPMHNGFGLGIRIRNENLVFKTFQIRLGYYPTLPAGENVLFELSGEKSYKPRRYSPGAPSVIGY